MKIVVLASLAMSLTRFRGRLIAQLIAEGHEVLACAPDRDEAVVAELAAMGARFAVTPMARAGLNPLQDAATLLRYVRLFLRERPDVVIAYTQKPIIYGGLAARLFPGIRYHVIMSGLGYVYSSAADSRRVLRRLVSHLYRAGVKQARTIFVFNGDDRRLMLQQGIIDPSQNVVQVPGSGIDTDHYAYQPLPMGPPTFLMTARLMQDKGVGEYIEAARAVRRIIPDARFLLLGRPENENPTGYSAAQVEAWGKAGLIEHIDETRDVRPYLAMSHAFVLPSYYREGLPRTILEALSVGRPVITCDLPGCRDAVTPGENGWLVLPRSPGALTDAMMQAATDRCGLDRMSRNARALACDRYDVRKVNAQLIDAMALDAEPVAPPTGSPQAVTMEPAA